MAEKTFTTYESLSASLAAVSTVTDLFKLANSEGFKNQARSLSPDDLASLRTIYRERQKELDGKVQLQEFAGQVLNLTDIEWWHSTSYDNDGVTIRFHLDDSAKEYKALTSSAPVVRFCGSLDPLPSDNSPIRILLGMRPVRDEKRAAQGQKVFTVKRLPSNTRGDGSEGAPF